MPRQALFVELFHERIGIEFLNIEYINRSRSIFESERLQKFIIKKEYIYIWQKILENEWYKKT